MDGQRWQRVKEIFSAALEQDAALRPAYLEDACGADLELRAEVDSLLAAHSDTEDSAIDRPAAHAALRLGPEPQPVNWIGRRVGDYRIVEEVGRGGMSEVYKGVRDDDEYHKEVAVKVLRSGYDTQALLRRFKVETQILATLDHPNIARLLDAGSTPEGLPYLVMDYIKGVPIDEYCRRNQLSLDARLTLFRKLCGAVQYVHQHLMVHGDLKCSNVLVSEQGAVKLLDFGIARLLGPSTAPGTPEAKRTAILAMTPEYASPEQIRGGAITTSSDVYSLGVVLYQLVTGVLPHRIRGEFSFEIASEIVQREAVAPSAAAKTHATEECTGFGRQLRGDLDNIILMALEKDPARRYSSVEKLEDDIRRHVEGFPVAARSAGYLYQIGKFAGRHKALLAATGLVVITLIGGIVTTMRQADIAWDERQRAQRHFDEVRKLANVFMFDVHGAIQDLPGSTPARKMLVENSLLYLEALSQESANEPSLQRELASAYEKLADVQGGFRTASLGDAPGAIASYEKALAMREALAKANSDDREVRRELLRNHGKLSEMLTSKHDMSGAIDHSRSATRLAQALVAMPGATAEDRRNVATAMLNLGWQVVRNQQVGDGVLFMRQAVAAFETLRRESPDDMVITRNLALAYQRLGETLLENTQSIQESYTLQQRGLELAQQLRAADPHNTRYDKVLAYSHLSVGAALSELGQQRAALAQQLKGVDLLRATVNADARNDVARYDAAFALGEASTTLILMGELKAAEVLLTESLAILSRANGIKDADLNSAKQMLGLNYFRLGVLHAVRAAEPDVPPAERTRRCTEARKWLGLGEPIISASNGTDDVQWHSISRYPLQVLGQKSAVCTTVSPPAS